MNKSSEQSRRIKSYVRREGRMTGRQTRALEALWPKYGLGLGAGLLMPEGVFGRVAPLVLEIGFGMGSSLLAMAQAMPDHDFIGIEVHRPGVGALLADIEDAGVENIRVYCADANLVFDQCIADDSLDIIQIFFPDPWPKARHHKRRLIQTTFVDAIAGKLKLGARLHLATDWENYAEHMMVAVSASEHYLNPYGAGQYAPRPEFRPKTKFEQRGARLGHGVWDLIFIRS